jgi:hypothetical protein
MRFDGFVGGALGRLAAALLIALLAGPDLASASTAAAAERATPPSHSDGMAATPARAASVYLAIAPAGVTAPADSATARVPVSFHPLACRAVTDGAYRLPAAVRSAPTVLRV